MSEQALYTSECVARNFWQTYRIFADRVELDALFGTITIPLDQIEGVELSHALRINLRGLEPVLKLDWTDFTEHIVLDSATGLFRHFSFTPSDPEAFYAALQSALDEYHKTHGNPA